MFDQIRRGGIKYIFFILLDVLCLALSNVIAFLIYSFVGDYPFEFSDYIILIIYMIIIDVLVNVSFNSLNRVLRRNNLRELYECFKHVAICFVILALILFSMKKGATFSRLTIYFTYIDYFLLMFIAHSLVKRIATALKKRQNNENALLITTDGYSEEGLSAAKNAGLTIKGIFITDKTNEGVINNIPIFVDRKDAAAFLCWEWIDKVYVCGPESIDVPELLINACKQMEIPIYTSPLRKSFDFEIIKIRTALTKDDSSTGLSFFEGEHDIPFQVRRLYTIFESEQDGQKGFHAHKQSWHLLFCPYGSIDVMIDTGKERKTISLSDPSVGLILHPSIWREMVWRKRGSVLCVAASGHYDADRLRVDYSEYLRFLQEKEWSATMESSVFMGDVVNE